MISLERLKLVSSYFFIQVDCIKYLLLNDNLPMHPSVRLSVRHTPVLYQNG